MKSSESIVCDSQTLPPWRGTHKKPHTRLKLFTENGFEEKEVWGTETYALLFAEHKCKIYPRELKCKEARHNN